MLTAGFANSIAELDARLAEQRIFIAEALFTIAAAIADEVLSGVTESVHAELKERVETLLVTTSTHDITTVRACTSDIAVIGELFVGHKHITVIADDALNPGDVLVAGDWFSATLSPTAG